MSEEAVIDKLKGGWAGQMAGVTWGDPTEFRWRGSIMLDSSVPPWRPRTINAGFDQDDIYVEIPFLDAMRDHGVNCSWEIFGDYFRDTEFRLWHANWEARNNLKRGISSPDSGHYANSLHADDIDWQIESDFVGQMCPGQVNAAIEMAWRAGHVMNYGDGVYGGVFVAAMHASAFTASSVDEIIEAGRQAVPESSEYRQVIEDVLAWKAQGNTWEQTWQLLQDKWGQDDRCPDGVGNPLNIDAKLNGAYVLIGLLYGKGDFEQSMRISMRAGQDSDCNPSSVGGILGNYLGFSNIPDEWKSTLQLTDRQFAYTDYSFNDAVNVNLELAREVLLMNGGWISGTTWYIPEQDAVRPPILEQWPEDANDQPILNASAKVQQDRTVKFSASASDDDGIKAYQWYFGDLSYADGPDVSHTYRQDGTYDAICYVTDDTGNTAWQVIRVIVGPDSSSTSTPLSPTQTPPGTDYYVDSVNGQDSNSGLSPSLAWQTLTPVNDHTFEPGDTIHFARGSRWDTGLIFRDSGTADHPITLTSYGTGDMPVFEKPGGIAIWITGSYVVIDGLRLQNAANDPDIPYDFRGALLLYYDTEHNVVRNSEFTNAGVGIKVFGQHHLIEHNYIHDLILVYDRPKESYGAIGISVNDSNIEVAHNHFENCRHEAAAYGYDGGAIEIEGFTSVKDNIYIHHNVSTGSQGFIEVTETKTTNVTVAHNISDDYQQFIAWDTTTRPSDFLAEHNTVIRTHPENACPLFTMFYYREEGPTPDESWLTFRNNIFYTTWRPVLDNADYPCNYPHDHNLFYTPSGSAISDPVGYPLGPGDVIADPQFVDLCARDLRLQPSSPAIDMGIDLGYTSDYDDNPAPIGAAPDAGAYEYQGDD